jgi:hypothetical protein
MNPNRVLRSTAQRNFRFAAVIALVLGVGALCACETQRVTNREDNLAAAGFILHLADTPEKQAMLKRLPPHRFVQRWKGDVVHYVYADPLVCSCLYVGTQAAYNQYKSDRQQEQIVDAQQTEAQAYSDAAWNWSAWGPWGPQYGFVYGTEFGW